MAKKIHPNKRMDDVIFFKQRSKIAKAISAGTQIVKKSTSVERLPYKKAIKFRTQRPSKLFYFAIAGMIYIYKDIKQYEAIFEKLEEGDLLVLKHEPKNKFDPCACAIYHKGSKLGYVPREFNFELLELAQAGKLFTIMIHKMNSFSDFYNWYKSPEVVITIY